MFLIPAIYGVVMKVLLSLLIMELTGCVSYNTQLHNDTTGQKMTCRSTGGGLIGETIATTQYNNCMHDAITLGFTE